MASRGPGKFRSDLDQALYELSLDGGPDEQAGSSSEGNGWYGLMRDGIELARSIADSDDSDVDADELAELRTLGKAGVIIFESTDGSVDVTLYASKSDLDKDWKEVEESQGDGEDFEENGGPRRNSKLRDVSSKYGAPMGRQSDNVEGKCTLERVRIDDGGYDTGGAYWGTGQPLWRAQDEDGNEKFFRAADRNAAKAELTDEGCTVVPGSAERQNEVDLSKLETDGTLAQLLEQHAESSELPSEYWRDLEVTPELRKAAVAYEAALWSALSELVHRYPPNGDADANTLMEDGDAPYNMLMTLSGSGVGIDDGRWDEFYDNRVIEDKVRPFLESKLGGWADDTGGGKLPTALDNAVYENEQRLGIERDEDNKVIEREENRPRHTPNGSTAWLVLLNGEQTDIVYFSDDMDASDVKRSLVSHDGYDPRITVKKRERRKTHAPDALATNGRRRKNSDEPSESALDDFEQYCAQASDRQVPHIYEKERDAGRREYARVAKAEMRKRGLD